MLISTCDRKTTATRISLRTAQQTNTKSTVFLKLDINKEGDKSSSYSSQYLYYDFRTSLPVRAGGRPTRKIPQVRDWIRWWLSHQFHFQGELQTCRESQMVCEWELPQNWRVKVREIYCGCKVTSGYDVVSRWKPVFQDSREKRSESFIFRSTHHCQSFLSNKKFPHSRTGECSSRMPFIKVSFNFPRIIQRFYFWNQESKFWFSSKHLVGFIHEFNTGLFSMNIERNISVETRCIEPKKARQLHIEYNWTFKILSFPLWFYNNEGPIQMWVFTIEQVWAKWFLDLVFLSKRHCRLWLFPFLQIRWACDWGSRDSNGHQKVSIRSTSGGPKWVKGI